MNLIRKIVAAVALYLLAAGTASAEWKKLSSGTMAWLHTVHFLDSKKGWIVGSRGTLLTTEDGGRTWTSSKRITQDTIRDIYFSDAANGWLLCEGSVYAAGNSVAYLMVTEDGGATWVRKDAFQGRDRVVRMFFLNSKLGCAAGEGGVVWCTGDGGRTWQKRQLPVKYLMLDGRVLDDRTLVLVGGGGTALRTDDLGASWSLAMVPPSSRSKVNSVFFVDQQNGWGVGAGGTILHSRNGGLSWANQSPASDAERTDVHFYSPTGGYAVGDKGVILHTASRGANWNIEPTETKHRLESVATAGTRAFAVGFGGTILTNEIVPVEAAGQKR